MDFVSFAEIITFSGIEKPLIYGVSPHLTGKVNVGTIVEITIGRRLSLGIITKIVPIYKCDFEIKAIKQYLYDDITIGYDLISLATWVSAYYCSSIKSVFEAIIPSVVRSKFAIKTNSFLTITNDAAIDFSLFEKRTPKQFAAYDFIFKNGKTIEKSVAIDQFSRQIIDSLIEKHLLIEHKIQEKRLASNDEFVKAECIKKNITLTAEQQHVANNIAQSISGGKYATHLIHGITGSGKTEVYMSAINDVLALGGDVIFLVPELALTPQTVGRVRAGIKNCKTDVIVWHSGLSDGERRDAWFELASGDAKVVIGARSAVFAPLKNVKLIIVDEEHETTYKQCETPRYNARDVAVYRAMLNNAVCLLGSATPSIESIFNTKLKKYHYEQLKNRIDGSKLPEIEVVDMKYEKHSISNNILSSRLIDLMFDRLSKKEQIILFLNRRGYAPTVFCKCCDYIATCPRCNVPLTYHKNYDVLRCYLCDYVEHLPKTCPKCGSNSILTRGIGTQKLEQLVAKIFPDAKIARVDSDVMTSKHNFRNILASFRQEKIDILIGTQMIAKGLDFPNVSLVGIVDADGLMNSPDFRVCERSFQMIVQVSGRAGRSDKNGIVVVQTRNPQSSVIAYAKNNMFDEFLANELATRSEFDYPPFRHIIRFILSCEDEHNVKIFTENLHTFLKENISGDQIEIRPAIPAIIEKINDKFRYTIFVFTKNVSRSVKMLYEIRKKFKTDKLIHEVIDVDPLELS